MSGETRLSDERRAYGRRGFSSLPPGRHRQLPKHHPTIVTSKYRRNATDCLASQISRWLWSRKGTGGDADARAAEASHVVRDSLTSLGNGVCQLRALAVSPPFVRGLLVKGYWRKGGPAQGAKDEAPSNQHSNLPGPTSERAYEESRGEAVNVLGPLTADGAWELGHLLHARLRSLTVTPLPALVSISLASNGGSGRGMLFEAATGPGPTPHNAARASRKRASALRFGSPGSTASWPWLLSWQASRRRTRIMALLSTSSGRTGSPSTDDALACHSTALTSVKSPAWRESRAMCWY